VKVRCKPSRIAGTGVFAAEEIAKGTCVFLYGGELHAFTSTVIEELHQLHGTMDVGYLFKVSNKKILDGFNSPSLARFLNHSCEVCCSFSCFNSCSFMSLQPNLRAETTEDGNDVAFFAMRKVHTDEELTFNYAGRDQATNSSSNKESRLTCSCGASRCRKLI
jgi:SET domain-containing protein